MPPAFRSPAFVASLLAAGLFVVFNLNGREIGTYDTQPAKLAARAFAQHGTLTLDRDIERTPALAERPAFARDRQGHVRSAYSPVSPLAGGLVGIGLSWLGVDLQAPRAPNLIAVITASGLTAAALALVFLTLVRVVPSSIAAATTLAMGLGTNLWVVHSQTLGQHEMVLFGVALCLFEWTRPVETLRARHTWSGALGLALAVTARLQTLPLATVLLAGLIWRLGVRRAAWPLALVGTAITVLAAFQYSWFGHVLGAMPELTRLHPAVHDVPDALNRTPWTGLAGLLVSPNRGLLVFSPIVAVAVAGILPALRREPRLGLGWGFLSAAAQVLAYGAYAVWWGGHSYGPRYALDALVPLAPAGAIALVTVCRGPVARTACGVALAWSMVVAASGAFTSGTWNTSPADVDRHHERLWDWRDLQIRRTFASGASPQNFNLFTWTSYRTQPAAEELLAETK